MTQVFAVVLVLGILSANQLPCVLILQEHSGPHSVSDIRADGELVRKEAGHRAAQCGPIHRFTVTGLKARFVQAGQPFSSRQRKKLKQFKSNQGFHFTTSH